MKNSWKFSFISLMLLGLFILFAVGSAMFLDTVAGFFELISWEVLLAVMYLDLHEFEFTAEDPVTGATKRMSGSTDSHGRPHGGTEKDIPLASLVPKVTAGGNNDTLYYRVTGEYLHGKRHGWHEYLLPDGSVHDEVYYEHGVRSDPDENGGSAASNPHNPVSTMSDILSFRILQDQSPWFLFKMEAYGYEPAHIEDFMAALQSRIVFYAPWSEADFTDAFRQSVADVGAADTLFAIHYEFISAIESLIHLRSFELRRAVIDRFLGTGDSTYTILQEHYPEFLDGLLAYLSEEAVRAFTDDLDQRVDSEGLVDLEDPEHIDVIDERILTAINEMQESFAHLSALIVLQDKVTREVFQANPVHEALKAAYFVVSARDGGREDARIPERITLEQNYPNPFNPATRVRYSIPEQAPVRLTVYDAAGREVAVLVDEIKSPGFHEVAFDASHLASGVYLYRLSAGDFVETRRAVLVK
jgi:hypothetical protein